jgi:hypothetical protein
LIPDIDSSHPCPYNKLEIHVAHSVAHTPSVDVCEPELIFKTSTESTGIANTLTTETAGKKLPKLPTQKILCDKNNNLNPRTAQLINYT